MDTFLIGAVLLYFAIRVILHLFGIDPCGGGCCRSSRESNQN